MVAVAQTGVFIHPIDSDSSAVFREGDVEAVNDLLNDLSLETRHSYRYYETIQHLVDGFNGNFFASYRLEGHLIGMACLHVVNLPTGRYGLVEDVVISKEHQGQGYGRELMEKLIAMGRGMGLRRLKLTSRPARESANALYPKLGFKKIDTNCYVLNL